jgi:hypothetical protein
VAGFVWRGTAWLQAGYHPDGDGDVLVAYPLVGPAVARLAQVSERLEYILSTNMFTTEWLLAVLRRGLESDRPCQVADAHPTVQFSMLVETAAAAASLPPGVGCFVDINPGPLHDVL